MLHRRSLLTALAAGIAGFAPSAWRPAFGEAAPSPALPPPAAAGERRTTVTFLLTNDIDRMEDHAFPDGGRRGGFARLAAVVKAERASRPHVVFAHAGDTLSPSLMSGLDRGAHIIQLTNMIAPDIFAVGNHEFDFGKATFLERMGEATFPLHGANLRDREGAPLPGFRDRAVLEFDGVRIGLTGLAYERSARVSSPEDLTFLSTVETTKQQTAALRAEGADFTVAVMHADRGDSLALQFARAADLLLTGHTHDLLVNFDGVNALAESGFNAHYVTAIDVEIVVREQEGRRSVAWWPQFRVIDTATVEPDPGVAAVVAGYQARLDRELNVPIATTATALDSRRVTVRTMEAAIGNLFADAMREAARAEAAILNGGGIRAGRVYAPGSMLTRRDILAELPFNNRVVVIEVTGRALRDGIEHGLRRLPEAGGRFPQVSGIDYAFKLAQPPGARVTALRVGGAPVEDGRRYRVAVVDFLARGGDDYTMFREATRITPDQDAPLLVNEVIRHIERLGTVEARVEGRIVAE